MTETKRRFRRVVVDAIAVAAKVDVSRIGDDTNLLDLGLDSLDFSEILINVEDAVGEQVPMELLERLDDIGEIVTVTDLCNFLAAWQPAALVVPDI